MDVFLGPWNALLVHPLINLLVAAYGLVGDFGFAIVSVTLGLRLVLYPLFVAQIRSQRAMQEIAPAINELKTKYKDRKKLSEEQMKLYRERGYNPAMGCLPLLVQMPILFAMYAALLQMCSLGSGIAGACPGITSEQFETIRYGFIPNPIATGEGLHLASGWLPWIPNLGVADPLRVLPVLAGLTQLISSVMAMPAGQKKSDDPQARMMQTMTYYFPVITVVIAWELPAGLSLYWVATTLFQIVQQYVVTGWGQATRWVPVLASIPSPADRTMRARQQAAIAEAESDMKGVLSGPGAQRAAGDHGPRQHGSRDRSGAKGRRRRHKP